MADWLVQEIKNANSQFETWDPRTKEIYKESLSRISGNFCMQATELKASDVDSSTDAPAVLKRA